jgi:hypothetical protein
MAARDWRVMLEHTDHVATLSASGAEILARMARLRVVEPPIELPSYKYSQIRQNRNNDDRPHTWLRERISSICQRQGTASTEI